MTLGDSVMFLLDGGVSSDDSTALVALANVTPRVTETIIKSLKLQLSLKARVNQVIEVGNQNSKLGVQIRSFKFGLVWID
jgi:hypothetical protein